MIFFSNYMYMCKMSHVQQFFLNVCTFFSEKMQLFVRIVPQNVLKFVREATLGKYERVCVSRYILGKNRRGESELVLSI